MTLEDLIDLKAYLDTLPAVAAAAPDHELSFPFNIRRGLGLWQLLYVDGETFTPDPAGERRGQSRRLSGHRPGPLRRMPQPAQLHRRDHRQPRL